MDTLKKLLANTWAVVALIVATIAALTVLLVTHTLTVPEAKAALLAFGWAVGITWHRGSVVETRSEGPGALGVLLFVAAAALVPLNTACSHDGKASSATTERTATLAYTGAVVALEVLDARESAYLDSIAQPTPEQLKASESRVERLKRARDALALVRDWLTGRSERAASAELGQAARALRLVVEELRSDGVRIPASVLDGIQLAELFAGVAS